MKLVSDHLMHERFRQLVNGNIGRNGMSHQLDTPLRQQDRFSAIIAREKSLHDMRAFCDESRTILGKIAIF